MTKVYRLLIIILTLVSFAMLPAQSTTAKFPAREVVITQLEQEYFFTDSLGNKFVELGFDTIWNDGPNSWSNDLDCFVAKDQYKTYLYALDLMSRIPFDSVKLTYNSLFIGILDGRFSLVNDDLKVLL